jgi:hypothetical protein
MLFASCNVKHSEFAYFIKVTLKIIAAIEVWSLKLADSDGA